MITLKGKYNQANAIIYCACGCRKKIKKFDIYGRERQFISGHNGRKYQNPTQYKREWNHRNRKKRYIYKVLYLHKRKRTLIKLKGGKCKVCEIKYNNQNACIFDFHHRNPKTKSFLLGLNTLNHKKWALILKEVKKCNLLCSNCHRLIIGKGY